MKNCNIEQADGAHEKQKSLDLWCRYRSADAGLLAARWGFEPTLIERAPSPRQGGYMIDFWGLGYDVAERMDLLPVLLSDGYHIDELQLVDTHGAKIGGLDGRIFRSATDNDS